MATQKKSIPSASKAGFTHAETHLLSGEYRVV